MNCKVKKLELPTLNRLLYHLFSAALISVEFAPEDTERAKLKEATDTILRAKLQWNKAEQPMLAGKPIDHFEARVRELHQLAMQQLAGTNGWGFPKDTQLIIVAIKAAYERRAPQSEA